MPTELTASWYGLMRRGALLAIGVIIASECVAVFTLVGGSAAKLVQLAGYTLASIAGIVSTWMLTASQPWNPYWQMYSRWLARLGCVVGAFQAIVRIITVYTLQSHVDSIAPTYAKAHLAVMAGAAAMAWYIWRLAATKLRNRLLGVISCIAAFIIGLMLLLMVFEPASYLPDATARAAADFAGDQDWTAPSEVWSSGAGAIAFRVGFFSLLLLFHVGLWRSLVKAEKRQKLLGSSY